MSSFLQLGEIILDRLRNELMGISNFSTAPSIQEFISFSSPPNSICVIYHKYETNDSKLERQSTVNATMQFISQVWIVVLKVRHYDDTRQFANAQKRASLFIDKIIASLDGWKPHTVDSTYNHMVLRLVDGDTEVITKGGTLYIPFYFKSIYQLPRN